jgi:hypothetical protein
LYRLLELQLIKLIAAFSCGLSGIRSHSACQEPDDQDDSGYERNGYSHGILEPGLPGSSPSRLNMPSKNVQHNAHFLRTPDLFSEPLRLASLADLIMSLWFLGSDVGRSHSASRMSP